MSSTASFDRAFRITIGVEGSTLDLDHFDRGNWTGGSVDVGELRGSKYGISAAAHPTVDIASLTVAGAEAIYKPEYWDAAHCGDMPMRLAALVFDAAVQSGPGMACRWLQAAVGAGVDGVVGPGTLAALDAALAKPDGEVTVCAEFHARRMYTVSLMDVFSRDRLGISRRLCAVLARAVQNS